MSSPSVEDVESAIPLDLDDEVEGLPAYEESVSEALTEITLDDDRAHVPAEQYGQWVNDTARKRLSEKDVLAHHEERRRSRQVPSTPTVPSALGSPPPQSEALTSPLPSYDDTIPTSEASKYSQLSQKYIDKPSTSKSELSRTGLTRVDFGSRFSSHSSPANASALLGASKRPSPVTITCSLSLYNGNLILYGTSDGLRVLNTNADFPMRIVWTGLPVWDIRILRCIGGDQKEGDDAKTPRGSVLLLVGGMEDPKDMGRPKVKSGGEVQVRIWKLASLASLAKWTASQSEEWKGIDMSPPSSSLSSRKGKGLLMGGLFGKGKSKSSEGVPTISKPVQPGVTDHPREQLAKAWAEDSLLLPPTSNNKPADVIGFAIRLSANQVYIAILTTSHILMHIGDLTKSGFSFKNTRKFYLPAQPTKIGLLQVITPISPISPEGVCLGLWVGFGNFSIIIRNSDFSVLDFKPNSEGQGATKSNGIFGDFQNVWLKDKEYYVFQRGSETIAYSSPLILSNKQLIGLPKIHTSWPETPLSSLVVPDGSDLLLVTTNAGGEICTQRARSVPEEESEKGTLVREGGFKLDLQDGTLIGDAKLLPLSWGYIRDGVYATVKGGGEWRICAIEKTEA